MSVKWPYANPGSLMGTPRSVLVEREQDLKALAANAVDAVRSKVGDAAGGAGSMTPEAIDGCPEHPSDVSPQQAATCLYEAWKVGRRALATVYAFDTAVEAMFDLDPTGSEWEFNGCDSDSQQSPICSWTVRDDFEGAYIEMIGHPLEPRIEYVEFYG